MKHIKKSLKIMIGMLLCGGIGLSSCNKDKESVLYLQPVNLAVTGFTLKSDLGDQELDTVFFSIDLDKRIIFNADSLRKGTDVSKVVANITFSSTVSEALIEMSGGTTREGTIDYQQNPTDSIDFTGNVTLRIKADDGNIGTSYRIKVNVHKVDSDSLYWSELSDTRLPSRLPNPKKQKTVETGGVAVTLVEEADGTYSLSTCADLDEFKWNITKAELPFKPQIPTLSATDENLWILSEDGRLYKSESPYTSWQATDEVWSSMIGPYVDTVLGIKAAGGDKVFAQYPAGSQGAVTVPAGFPLSDTSNFVTLQNKWTLSPVAFLVGGRKADGTLSDITWAFDGTNWIELCTGGLPALAGASVIPYYNYRPSAQGDTMLQYKVWLVIGGELSDGSFNRTVYVSYDNGVNWATGASTLQLPEAMPAMMGCDNIVSATEKQADISDIWKVRMRAGTRADYELEGNVIRWECPYIYLFGGYAPDGSLYPTIWKGVLSRLTFTPIF